MDIQIRGKNLLNRRLVVHTKSRGRNELDVFQELKRSPSTAGREESGRCVPQGGHVPHFVWSFVHESKEFEFCS